MGTIQFACKVVVPGKTFLQHIINLTRGVPSGFHHIRLNWEFFKDINMWKVFLTDWNGHSFFLDSSTTPTSSSKQMLQAQWVLLVSFRVTGCNVAGLPSCSLIGLGALASNGRNFSPLLSPVRFGTHFSWENAFISSVIMSPWSL